MAAQDTNRQNGHGGTGMAAYSMTSAEYAARAVAIAVYPTMVAGQMCLVVADDEAEEAVQRFKADLVAFAPAGTADVRAWAAAKVSDLFASVHKAAGQIWFSTLPSGAPIVVLKKGELEKRNMSVGDGVRRAHLSQVAAALSQGLTVPKAVLEEYRISVDAMASREVMQ